ncbi:MAG: transcriptional regulator, Crp/Fnr family [Streptosporangiaceae bacterium]|nr:transcriptional regulator, Crp/Fnr family [Streptosporangiaceae bacterium]
MPERNASPPRNGFWNALDEAERDALRAAARPRTYAVKMPLCHQGDESDHIIVIENGWAKVTSATEDGHDVVLAVRGPGDIVGESAILGHRERSATVTAISSLRGLVVPASRFTGFLDEHPRAWRMVSGTVVRRLDDADQRLQAHASADGGRRLALLLIYLSELSEQYERPGPDGSIAIRPPLSQEELGSWVDASRETVARALKAWREQGVVRTGWRKITIVDRPRLRAYARGLPAQGGRPPDAASDLS